MAERDSHRSTHDISGSGDRYEALLEVLDHQNAQARKDRARELTERRRSRRESRVPLWLVAVLMGIAGWLWLFPPALLRVDPPPPQPIEQEEAALRFAMYVQAQRIKAHRQETGEYPARIEDAGPPLPGMEYTLLSRELYQLKGVTDRLTLTYRSDLPLDDFVGPGASVIDEGAL